MRSRLRFYAAFSLPTQRCFFCGLDCIPPGLLFSAYAEVFPDDYDHHLEGGAFLCLRRGVSEKEARLYRYRNFSLPTQRCFQRIGVEVRVICLFSAYAEVEGEENFVGDSEIIALGGASNETKDRPLG